MAENTSIEWCDHTFNPWWGCTKVSSACDHCYAEALDIRFHGGAHWGPKAPRKRTSSANWKKPLFWNARAAASGKRYRVFCASMADVFDNQVPEHWRKDLWKLIRETQHLDWLLLTKRPQNIAKMLPEDWGNGWPHVWLGATVENQEEAARRIPKLISNKAVVHFLSMEPLLENIDLNLQLMRWSHEDGTEQGIDWIIVGGESGPEHRPTDPAWFRSIRDQCVEAGVPFLFKQWYGRNQSDIVLKGRSLDGVIWDQYPNVEARI